MLSQSMIEHLNKQINLEFYSSNTYLQMSAWADNRGLTGCADFLKDHAVEEMMHMQKLFDYVLETGGMPILGAIEEPRSDYDNIHEVFSLAFDHEKIVSNAINNLVAMAFDEKDFSTFNFLQWYVAEQHEEENLFQTVMDKFELMGNDPKNLYFLDNEIAKLKELEMSSTQGEA